MAEVEVEYVRNSTIVSDGVMLEIVETTTTTRINMFNSKIANGQKLSIQLTKDEWVQLLDQFEADRPMHWRYKSKDGANSSAGIGLSGHDKGASGP